MSLTSFLKRSKEARALLQEHFPCPLKSVSFPPLLAPPMTANYRVVGQAFDYLLRFYIQRHNPHVPPTSMWVANMIKATLSGEGEEIEQLIAMETSALPFLETAHAHHKQYLADGIITDELLESCINLAIIDGIIRAGEMRGALGKCDKRDIQDLHNLLDLIPSIPFLSVGEQCALNPIFTFPGGADCDLLIGGTLIEIKTTKISEVQREYYQQLLGYYLANFHKHPTYTIRRIGIYFSRHGYLWSVAIDDIASSERFLQFLPLWQELIQCYYKK